MLEKSFSKLSERKQWYRTTEKFSGKHCLLIQSHILWWFVNDVTSVCYVRHSSISSSNSLDVRSTANDAVCQRLPTVNLLHVTVTPCIVQWKRSWPDTGVTEVALGRGLGLVAMEMMERAKFVVTSAWTQKQEQNKTKNKHSHTGISLH